MRVLEHRFEVPLQPADSWALRADPNYDRFVAAAEGLTYKLLAVTRTPSPEGEVIAIETEILAEKSPLPSPLQTILGVDKFAMGSKARWYADRWDHSHMATFQSSPKLMSNRVTLRGQSWLERAPSGRPDACVVVYRVEIDVVGKVKPGRTPLMPPTSGKLSSNQP